MDKYFVVLVTITLFCGCMGGESVKCDASAKASGKAIMNSAPWQCEGITPQKCKDICIKNAAVRANDSTYCGQIRDKTEKDVCYLNSAIESHTPALCLNVKDSQLNSDCRETVGEPNLKGDSELYIGDDGKSRITFIQGDVKYRPAGAKEWLPLTEKTVLKSGDFVKTGDNSRFRLAKTEGTDLVGANREVQVTETAKPQPEDKRKWYEKVDEWIGYVRSAESDREVVAGSQ
jgi:hypothetical protein